MDKQSNLYTILYSSVMVIVVAVLLAYVAEVLKPIQAKNIEIAKKIEILKSVHIVCDASNVESEYARAIGNNCYIINSAGVKQIGKAFDVDLAKENLKSKELRHYPVFECKIKDGSLKYVLAVQGKGLWGPIWGYVSVDADKNSVFGAVFSHKGETPGLGAEIDKEAFQKPFQGKHLFDTDKQFVSIKVQKAGTNKGTDHEVDAISGGTITSKGVETMLLIGLEGYESFLKQ